MQHQENPTLLGQSRQSVEGMLADAALGGQNATPIELTL